MIILCGMFMHHLKIFAGSQIEYKFYTHTIT